MDANFRRDEPGKSPMGMDLVPVYEEAENAMDDGVGMPKITIDSSTAQNMGVRIEKARIADLSRTIKTIGSITYNEDSLHHIHVRANGLRDGEWLTIGGAVVWMLGCAAFLVGGNR